MKPAEQYTFRELVAEVKALPNCAVDVEPALISDVHSFADRSTEIINAMREAGVDLHQSHEAAIKKKLLYLVLQEMKEGRTMPAGKFRLYSKFRNPTQ